MFDEVGFDTHKTGVIKLPMLGGFKQFKCMVTLMLFPYDSALFGLVIQCPLQKQILTQQNARREKGKGGIYPEKT